MPNTSLFAVVAAIAAWLVPQAAMAEVVETRADGFITRDTVAIAATPREVWLALIKPGDWWNDAHSWSGDASNMSLTPQAGGCFCERIPGSGDIPMDGSAKHGEVVQAVPDNALRLRGELGPLQAIPATGVLTISLKAVDGGTIVGWEYNVGSVSNFDIKQISAAVDGVMSQQAVGLRDHLGALEKVEEPEKKPATPAKSKAKPAPKPADESDEAGDD